MAPVRNEVPPHTIDRTPEYEDFMSRLRDYHSKRGTTLDPEPKVGATHVDLFKVFNHVVESGGYDKISEEKLAWRRMASELGIYSNNEASTAFSLKEKFYKNLAAFEISTVHGKEPPPKDILEDVTAKGAGLLSRTRENFWGKKRESNVGATDSAASGDDGTPVRERPVPDTAASARASRGLREAPPQRVIFQPDTGPSRTTRHSSAHHASSTNSPAANPPQTPSHHPNMHIPQQHQQQNYQGNRGPSVLHHPTNTENTSNLVTAYQPRFSKPLTLRAVPTPSNAPTEFQKPRQTPRIDPRQPMQPGSEYSSVILYFSSTN